MLIFSHVSLCLRIDFLAFSRSQVRDLCYPVRISLSNYDIFRYPTWGRNKQDGVDVCVAYHRNLEALKSSAIVCGLCRLIANCIDATLANIQKAVDMNYRYHFSGYEFWLCGRLGADGFQVLGLYKDIQQCWLMGGIGFCVEDGKGN